MQDSSDSDLRDETKVSLPDLAKRLDVHISTVWRWCLRGVRSHRLESFSIGGRRYTTGEAFARWSGLINGSTPPIRTSSQRAAALRQADRDLDDVFN
jgi:hypothetical protein